MKAEMLESEIPSNKFSYWKINVCEIKIHTREIRGETRVLENSASVCVFRETNEGIL